MNLLQYQTEGYITEAEKELFELILYHRKQYENTKTRQGGLHPDDIEIMKLLDKGQALLIDILEQRKNKVIAKQKPMLTNCPQCNITKERKPIWEEKNEHGYMCNKYKCDECKIEYLDTTPNNGKDQLSWYHEHLALFEKNKKEIANAPTQIKEDVAEFKNRYPQFIKACEEEEKALEILTQAEQKRDKAIAEFRDYLLTAKIKNQWGNPPAAIN
ncbi:MAG: hypothetical protein HY841_02760 [Bacteroidetes bacterium]|nr:hypothetical protein [Bacteroidota bacterium]